MQECSVSATSVPAENMAGLQSMRKEYLCVESGEVFSLLPEDQECAAGLVSSRACWSVFFLFQGHPWHVVGCGRRLEKTYSPRKCRASIPFHDASAGLPMYVPFEPRMRIKCMFAFIRSSRVSRCHVKSFHHFSKHSGWNQR